MHDKKRMIVLLSWILGVYMTSCVSESLSPEVLPADGGVAELSVCSDGAVCPLNTTCCANEDGAYGCCPVKSVRVLVESLSFLVYNTANRLNYRLVFFVQIAILKHDQSLSVC